MDGLNRMATRLNYRGGKIQQDRMIKDKRKTLDRAILYSYQGAKVRKEGTEEIVGALMNPNKVKLDYDEKTISIGYESDFSVGTIFEWINTGTYWIIYLQDLTELSYFHGDVRKCNYVISWEDENGNLQKTYAAVKGPMEKTINTIYKSDNAIDIPNYSLELLIPNNEINRKYFDRYSKFFLTTSEDVIPTCWRVEARDSISSPGVLEVYATEHYYNEIEDDLKNGIVGGLIEEIVPENVGSIEGETFIKPKAFYSFIYDGNENAVWEYDDTLPIEVEIEDKTISIKWLKTYSGEFVLKYGDSKKTIIVESLF